MFYLEHIIKITKLKKRSEQVCLYAILLHSKNTHLINCRAHLANNKQGMKSFNLILNYGKFLVEVICFSLLA